MEFTIKILMNIFEGILRERPFEGNILLAETDCYNLSRCQDSNLRPRLPKHLIALAGHYV
jgi:hypothetical protein